MSPLLPSFDFAQNNAWALVPTAVLLGALHGLEPGHSKTMMAAFIISVKGTIAQAIILGLSATISHTMIVWIVALIGLHFGSALNSEAVEPYFEILSALLMFVISGWMLLSTLKILRFKGLPPHHLDHHHNHDNVNGDAACGTHSHNHMHGDAHAQAHAADIERRFSSGSVTTGQTILFGLTGGLIPCPAAITVLLVCLQLKKLTAGVLLVFCFSVGLAVTMVMSGVVAAISIRHVTKRWHGLGHWLGYAPLASSILIMIIAINVGLTGLRTLHIL